MTLNALLLTSLALSLLDNGTSQFVNSDCILLDELNTQYLTSGAATDASNTLFAIGRSSFRAYAGSIIKLDAGFSSATLLPGESNPTAVILDRAGTNVYAAIERVSDGVCTTGTLLRPAIVRFDTTSMARTGFTDVVVGRSGTRLVWKGPAWPQIAAPSSAYRRPRRLCFDLCFHPPSYRRIEVEYKRMRAERCCQWGCWSDSRWRSA